MDERGGWERGRWVGVRNRRGREAQTGRGGGQRGRGGGQRGRGGSSGVYGGGDGYGHSQRGGQRGRGGFSGVYGGGDEYGQRGGQRGRGGYSGVHGGGDGYGQRGGQRGRGGYSGVHGGGDGYGHSQRGGRGRGGHGGEPREQRPVRLGFMALQDAVGKDPDDIALDFGSQRCLPAFQTLVDSKEMTPDMVALLLKVLAKVCQCRSQEYLFAILSVLNDSMFLLKHVKAYLCRMTIGSSVSEDFPKVIGDATTVFRALLQRIPQSSDCLPIVDLLSSVKKLKENGMEFDSDVLEKITQLTQIQEESYQEVEKQEKQQDTPHSGMATDSVGPPPNNFRDISVVPQHDDIHSENPVYLRRNKVDGAYDNLDHYLDVQFRLLREDFVMPLRDGIKELIASNGRTDLLKRLSDIRVYFNVRVLYPECTGQGLVYRLKFDNSKFQRYRWENGKRLIFGSLLCLSKNQFQNFLFATVVNRELKDLAQGIVTVKFVATSHEIMSIQQDDVYQMVETTAYFEAYRHVLTALQDTKEGNLPFESYFVQCSRNVSAPKYLRRAVFQDPAVFDFSPIVRETRADEVQKQSLLQRLTKMYVRAVDATKVPVLDTYCWPSAEDMGLDISQLDSLKIALTRELAIIQGPPGTGKTYMGLKIAKLFLHNKDVWLKDDEVDEVEDGQGQKKKKKKTKPILVICYTNHALDQFLEGIEQFHPEGIIRIGGRSSSEALKSKNLSAVKQQMQKDRKVPRHIHRGFAEIRSDLEDITQRMTLSTEALKKCRENILTENTLKRFGLITDEQYKALKKPYQKKIVQGSVIVEWLNLTTVDLNEEQVAQEATTTEPVGLLENLPATFDGRRQITRKIPGVEFGGKDFTLLANVMTGIGGTIVSKARPQGGWKENCKSMFVNEDGFVTFCVGGAGMIQSRTKINDGQHHDLALVYVAEEGRVLLYVDSELENDSILPLMADHHEDIVKVGFTCEGYPLVQPYFSGIITNLTYHPNSAYKDQITGEGAFVQTEAAAIHDQRIVDGEYDEMLDEIARVRDVNTETYIDVVDPTKEHVVKQQGGWQVQDPKKLKKRIERTLKRELISTDIMSDEEARRAKDLWKLSLPNRWRLYRKWTNEIVTTHENSVMNIQEEYEQGIRKLQEVRNVHSFEVLRDSHVIGMTTTGAAKYREILQQVRPRITIVEEAAEVLESHIVTALTPACEHLILIGDHKQLRPNPTVYDLAKSYKLDVSLFERLVKNDLPYACLRAQHRMRPEISRMMKHIYPILEDHDSVNDFDNIKGVNKNIFFIQHHIHEASVEDIKSHSNDHEAKFLIALCRYFLQQNYKASQITILTPYVGQLLAFKKHMIPPGTFKGIRVCTVDNFQGEENDIILMSLVRSNDKHKIGFLSTDNRICVALSRAKKGFFCMGNIALFEAKNELWKKIIGEMRESDNVGDALTLSCQNHPTKKIEARRKEDFSKAPNGGCMQPCEYRLTCGHVCEQLCHPKDLLHEEYKCRKPCEKTLCENNHKCKKVCYKDCGACREPVKKVIPSCGHEQLVPCSLDPDEFSCREPCEKLLHCAHKCDKKCGEACTEECLVPVYKEWPRCGHSYQTKCFVDEKTTPCEYPCKEILLCRHECIGTCSKCRWGRFHVPCQAKCGRVLFCDDECNEPCTSSCPPCSHKCKNRCIHSACKRRCGAPCPPCLEPCTWQCPHFKCTRKCGEQCDRERCNEPCRKKLKKCKHPCIGLCGEPCPKKCGICDKVEVTEIFFGTEDEDDARFVQLADCGHVFEVTSMDEFMDLELRNREKGEVSSVKMVKCPRCNVVIRTSLRYGNIIKKVLQDFEMIKIKVAQVDEEARQQKEKTLGEVHELSRSFPVEAKKLAKVLQSDYVTSNALNLAQNQTRFLQFLVKLKEIVEQLRKDTSKFPKTKINTSVVINELEAEIRVLKEWICQDRHRFGEQELEDFNEELLRSLLLFTHKALETQLANRDVTVDEIETKAMRRVEKVLEKGTRLGPQARERYMKFLETISGTYCHDVRYISVSESEKTMIIKAMDLKQGHWFKCPKGHIYCIDQCGGAMEEGKCPECGSMIGGTQHRLREDNRLAGEMDGARHAAWSQFQNMANFDVDDFM